PSAAPPAPQDTLTGGATRSQNQNGAERLLETVRPASEKARLPQDTAWFPDTGRPAGARELGRAKPCTQAPALRSLPGICLQQPEAFPTEAAPPRYADWRPCTCAATIRRQYSAFASDKIRSDAPGSHCSLIRQAGCTASPRQRCFRWRPASGLRRAELQDSL